MHLISHLLKEAKISSHFLERMKDRLDSQFVKPEFPFQEYKPKIDFLAKIEYQTTKKIGIIFPKLDTKYKAYDPTTGKVNSGRYLWIIVQHNEFDTIMFKNDNVAPDKVETVLHYEPLKQYIEKYKTEKDGAYYLKDKEVDMNYIKQNLNKQENPYAGYPKIKYNKEHWYIDTENEQLVNKRNNSKTIQFYDVDEETFEEILNKTELTT